MRAWCLYDWANSAFATSVVAAILPVYFAGIASRTMAPHQATARWAFASAAAMLLSGVLAPTLGAWADRGARRKPLLAACVAVGALGTLALAFAPANDWRVILLCFGVAFIAFAVGNGLYDALLPAVAEPDEMHRVSSRGFALGYLGGGILLAVHLAMILKPEWFHLPDAATATRIALASVAAWWVGFSLPLFRHVREPLREAVAGPQRAPISQVFHTLMSLRKRPDLWRFLLAFWLYSDGIGTVVKMATVYGSEVGIGRSHLIGSLLLVQLVAAPASLAFGRLVKPIGPQRAVVIGLAGYVLITICGFIMTRPIHFWMIAVLVALFQGGTQALSRSMFVTLIPRRQTAELFGFYSVSEKLAGVVGPLLFGTVASLSGGGRYAVLTLMPMFIAGAFLLMSVNLERGAAQARADEA
ncbi:MAG: MFS transporter [Candidatus Eisenbacteria bacterium]|uniref:MFS transporter n=1 Tax=Eiseniibacteriota bacterium TaxID=2212470 RepID=A0A849SU89_UNCEI|nr:MFS transporter [Candidatus Eisenbacteria bacterium]